MDFLRKFLSVLVLITLWLFVGVLGCFFVISQVLKPPVIKSLLGSDSGYPKMVSALKSNLQKNGMAADPMTAKILEGVTPDLLQKTTEDVIDRYFAWLKGDDAAMTLSAKAIQDQLFKNINISASDLPLESQQFIPDVKLPLINNSNQAQMRRYYRWVFADQPYIAGIILALMTFLVLLRFKFKDRAGWLFWAVFIPTLGSILSFTTLFLVKTTSLKSLPFIEGLSADIKEIVILKVQAILGLLYNAELQLILVEGTVVVFLFVLYLIAKHYSKPPVVVAPPVVAITTQPAPPPPAASPVPPQAAPVQTPKPKA